MYPFKRVLVSFSLCPALVGIFLSGYFATIELMVRTTSMNAAEVIVGARWFGGLAAVIGTLFYGVPALLLVALYAWCELYRCPRHLAIIGLAGGLGALIWGEVLPLESKPVVNAVLGCVTSFLMALYALPRKPDGR